MSGIGWGSGVFQKVAFLMEHRKGAGDGAVLLLPYVIAGVWRGKLRTADEIADELMDRLLADMPIASGDRVSILVNSLGATPAEELYILYRIAKKRLGSEGATIAVPLVGRYATSMEMSGVSFTLCKLDADMEAMLKAPCDCAFWKV